MGTDRVTVRNLEVVQVDTEDNVLMVKGAVPGGKNGWVLVRDAVKKAAPADAPFPASLVAQG